ncbi:putative rRNA methyltransferase YqxC [Alicyclobacillus contaminans]|uniref:TlyA family RNA methyltransferase n=1 Tax=Alicyclobacillus contaminans TaxID=392016 RepID=UPI0004174821|nr:TlyA family RNA methyltransferase [Alicyclobacillus contaminans]GMA52413.1 putative rRNA methyltransferase YqxC [Alicyclobacillus contaminans]
MKSGKLRLDVLLVQRGLFQSREAARRAIMAGWVTRADGQVLDKPGTQVAEDIVLNVYQPTHQFVGRGGVKLEHALDIFAVPMTERVVVDVGASTGGFTDCALQHGARRVYAVDVGYGQLAWKLRNDERVVVMERTNFRHVDVGAFSPRPDIGVMDVSFISTQLLIPKLQELLVPPGEIISLIKPQFEAGREHVGKGGIVRDPKVHLDVLERLLTFVYDRGMGCAGLTFSPIQGGDGNIEYLAHWVSSPVTQQSLQHWLSTARDTVMAAWEAFRQETPVL